MIDVARRPGRPARAAALGVLLALATAGCGTGPAWSHPAARPNVPGTATPGAVGSSPDLIILAGQVGAMSLELVDDRGSTRPLALPDGAVAWISGAAGGQLLATALDGRAFLGQLAGQGPPSWAVIRPAGFDSARLAGPLAFGTLSPDGQAAAFLAADFGSSDAFELVLIDPASGAARLTRLSFPAEGAPPAWLAERLLILTRERADGPGILVVDPARGSIEIGPGPLQAGPSLDPARWSDPIAGLSVSADGSAIALASGRDGRIVVAAADSFLAGAPRSLSSVPVDAEPGALGSVAWLALAPNGDRLALVRTGSGGDAVAVTIHEARAGWAETRRIVLPAGSDRAVVAWLTGPGRP